jgi:predicted dehydrogenase
MIAIIGYGKHVTNTIIPALQRTDIRIKYILVRNDNLLKNHESVIFTDSITDILNDVEVTHVYIATPLSTHYNFSKLALLAKKNVLCEKPISSSLQKVEELFSIAKTNDVLLDEMEMFTYHKQFKNLKKLMKRPDLGTLLKVTACFQVPHLQKDNIRYDKAKEGGALFDIGFYPIVANLSLMENSKLSFGKIFSQELYEVDLTGVAIFVGGGVYGIATWGLGAIYKNNITLEYSNAEIIVNRAFSKPFNLETKIVINMLDGTSEDILIPQDDHFGEQFMHFTSKNTYEEYGKKHITERCSVMNQLMNYQQ